MIIKINDFVEYEKTNEKINLKKIGKGIDITLYTLMGLFIGYSVLPKHIKKSMTEKVAREYVEYKINKMDNIEKNNTLKKAIEQVINKIKNSKNIKNKEYLISRIKNATYKNYDKTKIFKTNDNTSAFYFYYEHSDEDYIFLDPNKNIINNGYYIIIHELNHLIDKHKIDKKEININNLITSPKKEDYIEYFKDFKKINIKNIKFYNIEFDRNVISIGDIYYQTIKNKEDYYLSDDEIYARISNMKSFFLNKGYINNINDPITEKTIEHFKKRLINLQKRNPDDVFIGVLDELHFIIYLPILNMEKLNDLNFIARVEKDNKDVYKT